MDSLRLIGRCRPAADPELAVELRAQIDDAIRPVVAAGPVATAAPVTVTKDRITRALSYDSRPLDTEAAPVPGPELAIGALVDALFRQLVTVGHVGDAMTDAMEALTLEPRHTELVRWIRGLPAAEHAALRSEVRRQAADLARRWPQLAPGWLPRTQERMQVSLAGGAVILAARVDLTVGVPSSSEPSIGIVELKSGARRSEHRADLHFYALVETLRRGVPPFVVATYYSRTGEIDVEPVTPPLLRAAAHRVIGGATVLLRLAPGYQPSTASHSDASRHAAPFDGVPGHTADNLGRPEPAGGDVSRLAPAGGDVRRPALASGGVGCPDPGHAPRPGRTRVVEARPSE